ncbi:MAG: hypothetical protein ABJN26_09400 [Stappiaceae bacterium]
MSALRKLADIVQLGKNADLGALVDALLDLVQEKQEEAPDALGQLLSEIILSAYPKLSAQSRRSVAERAGPSMLLSKPLAIRLASDEIEIARPVIRFSPVLTDDDLMALVPELGTEHLHEISSHRAVRADIHGVIDKRAAREAPEGDLECADLLFVGASDNHWDEEEQFRSTIEEEKAGELIAQTDTESESEFPVGTVADRTGTVDQIKTVPGLPDVDSDLVGLIESVRSRRLNAGDALRRLFELGKQRAVNTLLIDLCNAPWLAKTPFVFSADDKLLAAVCRKIETDTEAYSLLVKFRGERLQLTAMECRSALKRYEGFSRKRALSILSQEQVASYQQPLLQ